MPIALRWSINRNLTEIVELHEEMLGELHRAVPNSEYTQQDAPSPISPVSPGVRGHHRWRSLDAVPEDKAGIPWLQSIPGLAAEPQVAAEVAKIFNGKVSAPFAEAHPSVLGEEKSI